MATVALRAPSGQEAVLQIDTLPGRETWGDPPIATLTIDSRTGMVQLLEEVEYEFTILDQDIDQLEPSEVFSISNTRATGRVAPRGRTGIVRVDLQTGDGVSFSGEFEVRSRKLDYRTEYRWMLDRIANEAAELALLPFAASRVPLGADFSASPETLYQRFEFLCARLESEEFRAAIEHLRHRPHSSFQDETEVAPISKPARYGSGLFRQLTKTGSRVPISKPIRRLTTLPRTIERPIHTETLDTAPNRFVRFVVEGWIGLVDAVEDAITSSKSSRKTMPAKERGLDEVETVRAQLEQIVRIPAVRGAGRLNHFPSANTVIRSRAGYREFLSAFQVTNALAQMTWEQPEDLMSAGQHDVPTLYEYWVFLEVARIVKNLDGFAVNKYGLVSPSKTGLSLQLRKANEVVVEAAGDCKGTPIKLELWFNKSFVYRETATQSDDGSWSVRLRPDVSLSIEKQGFENREKTWLHFDAKYKVKRYTEKFADPDTEAEVEGRVVPADIQKMHTYRDAIRRSAGAYVIYPGDQPVARAQYHELLPGLGAFALKPSHTGDADAASSDRLHGFIRDVIEQVVSDGTNLQRDRYWTQTVHRGEGFVGRPMSFLTKPPADTSVLLGYVRGAGHLKMIRRLGLYNLRADKDRDGAVDVSSPVLRADFLILYGPNQDALVFRAAGDVSLRRAEDLSAGGYAPQGDLYLCLALDDEILMTLDSRLIQDLAIEKGATKRQPVSVTWEQVEQWRIERTE